MTLQSRSAQTMLFGVETTEGTSVTPTKRITDFKAKPSQGGSFATMAAGYKFPTVVLPNGDEMSLFDIEGVPAFGSLAYVFASLLQYTAPSGSTAKTWLHSPNAAAADVSKSFTVAWGAAGNAWQADGAFFNSWKMSVTRKKISMGGQMMAREILPGVSLSGSPVDVESVPILPSSVGLYYAATFAGLSSPTLIPYGLGLDMEISDRFSPVFALDPAEPSMKARVESEAKFKLAFTVAEEQSGSDFTNSPFTLAKQRNGGIIYVRVKATGAVIGAGPATYLLTADMALKINDKIDLGEMDGLKVVKWPCTVVVDSTGGKSIEVTEVNQVTAL